MKEEWRLLDLGGMDPLDTQIIYDMVGQAISEDKASNTIIICWPENPIVCLGYFQEIEKDIDLEYCQKQEIPLTRRVLGGGGVYLDSGQMFYQIISRTDSSKVPKSIDEYYRKFLEAPVQVYRNLGLNAEFRPVNDIQVEGRKISGNGAADVGSTRILTGNIIFDFDYDSMVHILKVPDEKFRDKVAKSLRERLTTIKRELGELPDREEVKQDLIRLYEKTLDIKLMPGELSDWERRRMADLRGKYLSDQWLHWRSGGRLSDVQTIRISATASVGTANYKALGGLIRVTLEQIDEQIKEIVVSGDFFMFPSNAIEKIEEKLIGVKTTGNEILDTLKNLYSSQSIESPGVSPEDFESAIKLAIGDK
jgi:lipoate-protein ligase A